MSMSITHLDGICVRFVVGTRSVRIIGSRRVDVGSDGVNDCRWSTYIKLELQFAQKAWRV